MEKNVETYIENSHPSNWFVVADELNHSAIVLYKDRNQSITERTDKDGNLLIKKPTSSKAYFLVAGFSIENLIKGILITNNSKLIEPEGKISNSISKGHNLTALSQKLKSITLSPKEKELISIFSEAIPNWSRYPIPKTFQKLENEIALTTEIHLTMYSYLIS